MIRITPYLPLAIMLATAGTALSQAAPASAASQSAAMQVLTLREALDYGLAHQPEIRRALLQVAAARRDAQVPRAAWLPQLGGSVQLIYGTVNNSSASYLNTPDVDVPRIGGRTAVATGSWSASYPSTFGAVTLDQQIYDFGRIAAQAALYDALTQVTQAGAEVLRFNIQLSIEESFDAVLAARQVLAATDEALKRALTHRDLARVGVHSGMRPPIELTRAAAEVARIDVRRIRAESSLVAARAALAASIGADALEVDAAPSDYYTPSTPTLDMALHLAQERNPQVVAALFQVRAQRQTTQAIGKELVPNLFFSSTLSGRAGGAPVASVPAPVGQGWLPDVVNWDVGAVLTWNILDGTVLARRSASAAREQVAQAGVAVERREALLAAQRAYLDLDAAQKVLGGLKVSLDAARANQTQADVRFRAGLGTIIELTDAESVLESAQVDLAIGQFAVAQARARLGRAIGENLFGCAQRSAAQCSDDKSSRNQDKGK